MKTAAYTWSLLDPKPQFEYHSPCDVMLCYWRGIVMTRGQALALAMERFGIWPTPQQRLRLHEEYTRACRAGALGDVKWRHAVDSGDALVYLRRLLNEDAVKQLEDRYTAREVLLWFTRSQIRPIPSSQPVQ